MRFVPFLRPDLATAHGRSGSPYGSAPHTSARWASHRPGLPGRLTAHWGWGAKTYPGHWGCPTLLPHQLADVGVVTVKSVKEGCRRHPLFDLYRRYGTEGFGVVVRAGIGYDELLEAVREIG